jgi:PadR family transcriptional regulator, regulatory protein PadR
VSDALERDFVKGTVEIMVLGVLMDGEHHGLEIFDAIANKSGQRLRVAEGSLYPALKRLEAAGLVESTWGRTARQRRARYYRISSAGRKELERRTLSWCNFAQAMRSVLGNVQPTETSNPGAGHAIVAPA